MTYPKPISVCCGAPVSTLDGVKRCSKCKKKVKRTVKKWRDLKRKREIDKQRSGLIPGHEFAETCRKNNIAPLPTLEQEEMNLRHAAEVFARTRKDATMYWAGDGSGEDAPRVFWFRYPSDLFALRMEKPHSIGLRAQRDAEMDEHLRQINAIVTDHPR